MIDALSMVNKKEAKVGADLQGKMDQIEAEVTEKIVQNQQIWNRS